MEEREIQYFEQFGETILDEYGGLYTADGVWLLLAPIGRHKTYRIKEGTQIIASHSFSGKSESEITFNPSDIEKVEMPDSVVYLEGYAFEQCLDLKSIKLSQSIRIIPFYCFWRCLSLESIVIPKNVSIIQTGAFMWCKNLHTVYLPKSICEIEEGVFTSCESLETIYVPHGMKEKYSKMLDDSLEKYIVEQPIYN